MDENLDKLSIKIQDEILHYLKSYSHGIPTYNDTFKSNLVQIVSNNFYRFNKEFDIITQRIEDGGV